MNYLKSIRAVLCFICMGALAFFAVSQTSQAQERLPDLPAPIQNLVDEGAQIRYLGREYGFDSWLTIKNGQEQYFYVLPDGKAFVMGVLFDNSGKLVTVDQVARLRNKGDSLLDSLTSEFSDPEQTKADASSSAFEFKTPAEQLYSDIEKSNWVPLGQPGAPVFYSFIDPQCGHCHALIENVRSAGLLDNGKVQVRIIPVGFKDESRAQAAFLIASPNPQERWYRHLEGDDTALPAKSEINQQGVQRNLAIMQSWKFSVTPMIVYRAKDGSVKIVRGQPKDLPGMIADIGARS